ncbi:MAG TPA: MlaD family protein [Candidatus Acidoferrum sp.]|nr:MlaD family protein [Candidatus Acidoferrum sp.]
MSDTKKPLPVVPEAQVVSKKRARFSFIWLIPAVAALAGIWIGITTIRNQGPTITIVFRSADGLEAGKTKIRYNGVEVGTLTTIRLSEDYRQVIATAEMSPRTEEFLVKDTQFWVVRPQISGANVSGLSTLISGAYIGMEIGQLKERERHYVALEDAPLETGGVRGRFFILKTPQLGSLNKGSPLYFRRLQAGQVASYELDQTGKFLNVKVFVQEPYDQFVTSDTRFWQASGIDVSLSARGLQIQTESLLSILVGGIAFETPVTDGPRAPAAENTVFNLNQDREEAFRPSAVNPQTYTVVFKQSVRGLSVGAPVEFEGIPIGEVTDVQAQFDAKTFEFSVPVTIRVDPERFGVKTLDLAPGEHAVSDRKKLMDTLVSRGLRAQLQNGSLITGSKLISLDFYPDTPPVALDWSKEPVQLPTLPGGIESIESSLVNVSKHIEQIPFKDVGDNLNKTLGDVQQTAQNLDAVLLELKRYPAGFFLGQPPLPAKSVQTPSK